MYQHDYSMSVLALKNETWSIHCSLAFDNNYLTLFLYRFLFRDMVISVNRKGENGVFEKSTIHYYNVIIYSQLDHNSSFSIFLLFILVLYNNADLTLL